MSHSFWGWCACTQSASHTCRRLRVFITREAMGPAGSTMALSLVWRRQQKQHATCALFALMTAHCRVPEVAGCQFPGQEGTLSGDGCWQMIRSAQHPEIGGDFVREQLCLHPRALDGPVQVE